MIHRAHLHEGLKNKATAPGKGKLVVLHTSCKVPGVDLKTATVTFDDGTEVRGDVVIGAGGAHSVAGITLPVPTKLAFSSGKSTFRFLVSCQQKLTL